jgi:hypothetical protein
MNVFAINSRVEIKYRGSMVSDYATVVGTELVDVAGGKIRAYKIIISPKNEELYLYMLEDEMAQVIGRRVNVMANVRQINEREFLGGLAIAAISL